MNLANIAVFVHAQLSTTFNSTCLALSQTTSGLVSHDQLNRTVKKQDFIAVYSNLIRGDIPNGGYLILDDTMKCQEFVDAEFRDSFLSSNTIGAKKPRLE